jgi:cell division control protein 6
VRERERERENIFIIIKYLIYLRILVLDEIDQIETSIKNASDLYKIFEWPYLDNSKLVLIGIANSLDFTDRLLPRLQINPNNQPKLINFTPYTRNEIIDIVKDRLKDIGGAGIIDDRALFWCASKIASTSGDIRKMLDICRRAIEILEKETRMNLNDENINPNNKIVGK